MSCFDVSACRVGNGIEVLTNRIGDGLESSACRVGKGLSSNSSRIGDGLILSASRIGGSLHVVCSVVCSVSKDFYLDVSPDVVWLTPDMIGGEFDIYSNVIWRID